jgi:hypothetical protein
MRRFLRIACLVAAPAVALASPAMAAITAVSVLGPVGTVTDLSIGTVNHTDDAVQFGAHYATDAPIDFFITLGAGDSNTIYFIDPSGQIANNTAATFTKFYASLLSAPAGTTLTGTGQDTGQFGFPTAVSPTELVWSGPPGLLAGEFTFISFTFTLPEPATGPETVEVAFGPTLSSVPEPSSWAMMLLGFLGLGFAGSRYARARRSAA